MRPHTPEPRSYELMTVLSPDVAEEEIPIVLDRIGGYVADAGGTVTEILRESPWGRRRLAYPIRHGGRDVRDGFYTVYHLALSPGRVIDVERELKLNDQIIRYLITHHTPVAVDPQTVEDAEIAAEDAAAAAYAAAQAEAAAQVPVAEPEEAADVETAPEAAAETVTTLEEAPEPEAAPVAEAAPAEAAAEPAEAIAEAAEETPEPVAVADLVPEADASTALEEVAEPPAEEVAAAIDQDESGPDQGDEEETESVEQSPSDETEPGTKPEEE